MPELPIEKVLMLGTHPDGKVFVELYYGKDRHNTRPEGEYVLSITGVIGPKRNGDCRGSCGQIIDHLADTAPVEPWTRELIDKLQEVWDRWHLNSMRAGCEHQRAEKWDQRPIDPSKPTDAYGKHFEGQRHASWNMLTWVKRSEHPEGLLSEPCPTCGYKFGSSWLYEAVPDDVVEFLAGLPESTIAYPWGK